MNEVWKHEIDKVYMSDVVCLDKETVEKIEDGHRMGAIFSRNPSEGSVVFYKKREWVGLTEDELERLIHNFGNDPHTLLDEVDARLRNRNT
jgi:hypothetical protein